MNEGILEKLKKLGLKRVICGATILAVLIAVTVIGFSLDHYYRNRAVPGTELAGLNISGMTPEAIESKAAQLLAEVELQFIAPPIGQGNNEGGGKRIVANAADLNISVDAKRTAREAIALGNEKNIFERFFPYKKKKAPLILTYDEKKIQSYLCEAFPDMTIDAVNAAVVYNAETGVFETTPGQIGKNIEVAALDDILEELAFQPESKTVEFTVRDISPPVGDDSAAQACDYANARLGVALNLTYNGRTVHTVERGSVAEWFDFSPDAAAGRIEVSVNEDRVRGYVTDTATPQISRGKVDRRVIRDGAGTEIFVLNQGQTGQKIGNMDTVAESIVGALADGVDLNREIELTEELFETITDDAAHWVDVNLSNQTTTLYAGATPVQTFVISSGKASTPTVTGKFKVYRRNASMILSGGSAAAGDAYYYPDTRWITFFIGGYAFHTAYWHESFGTPVSHGCINMHEAEAKAVWDWAPIGTPVYVHY
jgi:hypothetical protein